MVLRAQAQSHNGLTTNNYHRNDWISEATGAFLPMTLGPGSWAPAIDLLQGIDGVAAEIHENLVPMRGEWEVQRNALAVVRRTVAGDHRLG